jgi:hypothetical protein
MVAGAPAQLIAKIIEELAAVVEQLRGTPPMLPWLIAFTDWLRLPARGPTQCRQRQCRCEAAGRLSGSLYSRIYIFLFAA